MHLKKLNYIILLKSDEYVINSTIYAIRIQMKKQTIILVKLLVYVVKLIMLHGYDFWLEKYLVNYAAIVTRLIF